MLLHVKPTELQQKQMQLKKLASKLDNANIDDIKQLLKILIDVLGLK